MSRIINIYDYNHKYTIENYNNININDIDNIINYSVDFINCGCLHYFDLTVSVSTISRLILKLRQKGSLLLSLPNTKLAAKNYANNILNDQDFLSIIQDQKSVLSFDQLKAWLTTNCKDILISKIDYDNSHYKINITLERVSL